MASQNGQNGSEALPPIGVFWDIENCSVPKGKSALGIVQTIRERFFRGLREADFLCVCDISKESKDVIEELNKAQVTVVHINATSKNAADDKLRQCLRRFSDTHNPPATVMLISGDVNFASELSDLRHRRGFRIVLIHNKHVPDALLACAHVHHIYEEVVKNVQERPPPKPLATISNCELFVTNLPTNQAIGALRSRLKRLSDNCGGKVMTINVHTHSASVRFSNLEAANRAKKRMEGEDVYGNKIRIELLTDTHRASLNPKEKKDKQASPKKHRKTTSPRRNAKKMKENHHQPVPSAEDMKLNIPISSCSDSNTPSPSPGRPNEYGDAPSPAFSGTKSPRNRTPESCRQTSPYPLRPRGRSPLARTQYSVRDYQNAGPEGPNYGQGDYAMKNTVDRYSRDKSTRNVLYLQQQFYQEDQQNQYHDPGGGAYNEQPRRPFSDQGVRTLDHQGNNYQNYGGGYRSSTPSPYGFQNPSTGPYRTSHSQSPRPYPAGGYRPRHYSPTSVNNNTSEFRNNNQGNTGTYQSRNLRDSYFQPIRSRGNSPHRWTPSPAFGQRMATPSPCMDTDSMGNVGPCLELMVTNLDYNISAREWKKILFATFQQQVQVLNVYIQTQSDGSNMGVVCVPTIDEARLAIAQFHRKKIGYRRIHVALARKDNGLASATVRSEALALLKEATGQTLPLFKFIELFEKRFHQSVSVSELYQMKDVIEISDTEGSGRMVTLVHRYRDSPAPHDSSDIEVEEIFESPICAIHCPEGSEFYMTALDSAGLPNVVLQLKGVAPQVHSLLQSHNGSMPLMSFPACYAAEFGPIYQVADGGVPLEHLLTCVPGIQVSVSKSGIKKIHWTENKSPQAMDASRFLQSPALNQQLNQLSKEVVDLLRSCPQCRMPFSKFIPAYHHHFGRQCRVADYGYTKLAELFKAVPHVLQVLGTGNRGILTLTHRAQVKRFTSDLLRMLKSQTSKQMLAIEIPGIFMKVFNKSFDMTEYGVCYLEDMLVEIPDTVVMVSGAGENMVIAIPRRDQTPDEIERTKKFTTEVVDLLRHSPQCRMPFNKFIPSYHHHFGRQCRVADYGFNKLIDLFESIPDVVNIEDDGDEKILCLTEPELIKVLADQVMSLLESCPENTIPATEFLTAFMRFHGHSLQLQDFGVHNVIALMKMIKHVAKVEDVNGKTMIGLVDRSQVQQLAHRVLLILMEQPSGSMMIPHLKDRYRRTFGDHLDIEAVKEELRNYILVSSDLNKGIIKLVALMEFARDIRCLLRTHKGRIPVQHFMSAYRDHFGTELKPAAYGYPSIDALIQAVPHLLAIKGRGFKKTMYLNTDFLDKLSHQIAYSPVPYDDDLKRDQNDTPSKDSGILVMNSEEDFIHVASRSNTPLDILALPVPSAVPSPDLHPKVPSPADLMKFADPQQQDIISAMTPEEKNRQMSPLCRTPTSDMLQFAAQCLPGKELKTCPTIPEPRAEAYLKDVFIHPPPPSPLAYDPYHPAYQYYQTPVTYQHYPGMAGMATYQPYCPPPSTYTVYYGPSGAAYPQPQPQPYFTAYNATAVPHPPSDPGKAILAMISPKDKQEKDEHKGNVTSTPSEKIRTKLVSSDGSPIDENSDHVKAILALLSPLKDDGSPIKPVLPAGLISNVTAALEAVEEDSVIEQPEEVATPPSAEGKACMTRNVVMEHIAAVEARKSSLESLPSVETSPVASVTDVAESVQLTPDRQSMESNQGSVFDDTVKSSLFNVSPTTQPSLDTASAKVKEGEVQAMLSKLSIAPTKQVSDTESDLDSSRSGASPKTGTPKRSRIAAKFNVPIETERPN